MPKVSLAAVSLIATKSPTGEIGDYDGAANGLQVENSGAVTRIAAAVDASLATVKLAIAARADLLIVHHGLFWSPSHPWTGKKHELLRLLVENNLAVYSSHLPLDAHPQTGQQRAALRRARLQKVKTVFSNARPDHRFSDRAEHFPRGTGEDGWTRATGAKPRVIPGGPETCAGASGW